MIAYAKILDENTKIASVGLGTDASYYTSIGMTQMDVEQGYDGAWYLTGYAPEEPEAEKKAKSKQELYDEAAALDLKSIRPLRAKEAGTATMEDLDRLAQYEARIAEIRQAIHDIDNPSETSEEFDIESEND